MSARRSLKVLGRLLREEDGQMVACYVLLVIVGVVAGYMLCRLVASLIGGGDIACPDRVSCPDTGGASIFGNYSEMAAKPSYHEGPY